MSGVTVQVPYYFREEDVIPSDLALLKSSDGNIYIVQNGNVIGQAPSGISGEVERHVIYRERLRPDAEHTVAMTGGEYLKYLVISADGVVKLKETIESPPVGYVIHKASGRSISLIDTMILGTPTITPLYKVMDYATIIDVEEDEGEHLLTLGELGTDKPIHYGSSTLEGQQRVFPFEGLYTLYFRYANNSVMKIEVDQQEELDTGEALATLIETEINTILGEEKINVRYEDSSFCLYALDTGAIHMSFINDAMGSASRLGLANATLKLGIKYTPSHVILPSLGGIKTSIDSLVGGKIRVTLTTPPTQWSRCYVVSDDEPITINVFCGN